MEIGASYTTSLRFSKAVNTEHEIQPIISGERLMAVYSLRWIGGGDPPLPPSLESPRKLSQLLATEDRCLGWMLQHQYSHSSLERLGCGALIGRDRVVADCVLTASELMKMGNADDELSVHIVEAQQRLSRCAVDDYDTDGPNDEFSPEFVLPGGIHGAIPVAGGSDVGYFSHGALRSLRFYDDIVNAQSNDNQDEWRTGSLFVSDPDCWFAPHRYVLTFMRKGRALPLCVQSNPKSVTQAVIDLIPSSPEQAEESLAMITKGNMTQQRADVSEDLMRISEMLNDVGLFRAAVSSQQLYRCQPGSKSSFCTPAFIGWFATENAAEVFASAADHFGWDQFQRLVFLKSQDYRVRSGPGVFVAGYIRKAPFAETISLACSTSLTRVMDIVIDEGCDSDTPWTSWLPILGQSSNTLREAEFVHLLSRSRTAAEAAMLIDSLAEFDCPLPSVAVAQAVVRAARTFGLLELAGAVENVVKKCQSRIFEDSYHVADRNNMLLMMKLLLPEVQDIPPLAALLRNDLMNLVVLLKRDKVLQRSDDPSVALTMLAESGSDDLKQQAIADSRTWTDMSPQMPLLLLAMFERGEQNTREFAREMLVALHEGALARIESLEASVPLAQPAAYINATLPECPEVEQFLRSTDQSVTLSRESVNRDFGLHHNGPVVKFFEDLVEKCLNLGYSIKIQGRIKIEPSKQYWSAGEKAIVTLTIVRTSELEERHRVQLQNAKQASASLQQITDILREML